MPEATPGAPRSHATDLGRLVVITAATWLVILWFGDPHRIVAGPLETCIYVALLLPLLALAGARGRRWHLVAVAAAVVFLWQATTAATNRLPNPWFIHGFFPFSGKALQIPLTAAAVCWVGRGRWANYGCTLRFAPGTVARSLALVFGAIGLLLVLGSVLLGLGVVTRHEIVAGSSISKMPLWEAAVFQFLLVGTAEELVFRGFLQTYLDELFGRKVRLLGAELGWGFPIVALLFTLVHAVELNTTPLPMHLVVDPSRLVDVGVAALLFGYLRAYSGSLLPAILLHGLEDGLGDVLIPYLVAHHIIF